MRLWGQKLQVIKNNDILYDVRELWHKKGVLMLPCEIADISSLSLAMQTLPEVL